MSKRNLKDYEVRKELIKEYKNTDNIQRKNEIIIDIVNHLNDYIYSYARKYFPTYGAYYKDMYQEAVIVIMQYLSNYEPEMALTTYFTKAIHGAMCKCVSEAMGYSTYYGQMCTKVRRAEEKVMLSNDEYTLTDIANECDMPENRVSIYLDMNNEKKYRNIEELGECNSLINYKTPEDVCIYKEGIELLHEEMDKIDKESIIRSYNYNVSLKKIAEKNNDTIYSTTKKRDKTLYHLRNNQKIKDYYKDDIN